MFAKNVFIKNKEIEEYINPVCPIVLLYVNLFRLNLVTLGMTDTGEV